MKYAITVLLVLLSFRTVGADASPDESDSTGQTTPFRQKRWMTSISGFIRSSNITLSGGNGQSDYNANNYFYYLNGSYFLINRLSLGLNTGFSRSSSEELIIRESEVFLIGPILRYYVSQNKEGSLYFLGGLFYSRLYDRTALLNIPNPIDNILKGSGIGGSIGLGYTYVFKDLLLLEIGFVNNFSGLKGHKTNQITQNISNQNYINYEISFNFGLGIIIGKGIDK